MRRVMVWALVGAVVLSAGACSKGAKKEAATAESPAASTSKTGEEAVKEPAVSAHGSAEISWETSWDRAMERAKKENKPVIVDFYADWCVWCKTLDSTTYKDSRVVQLLASKVIPLKIDVDHGGRTLARQYRVSGLPTILIIGPDGRERGRIPGYLSASNFLEEVRKHL